MSINSFMSFMNAKGGMSLSNSFIVKIDQPGTGNALAFMCDEAQLPNTQAATGTIKGRYLGEGEINYPHTRIFTEMQLGFQCTADMGPLKFLNDWYGNIFREYKDDDILSPLPTMDPAGNSPRNHRQPQRSQNRTTQLNYPDNYCRNIYVTKTERGPRYMGGVRTSITYCMERAWPYAIDAVPLQFGSAAITKVTAQFYYTKHRIITSPSQGDEFTPVTNTDGNKDFDDPTKLVGRGGKLKGKYGVKYMIDKYGAANWSE